MGCWGFAKRKQLSFFHGAVDGADGEDDDGDDDGENDEKDDDEEDIRPMWNIFSMATWISFWPSWGCPGLLRDSLGGPLGSSWAVLKPSGAVFGLSWGLRDRLEALWGPAWAVLGRPGVLLGRLGSFRRPFRASLRPSWVRPGLSRGPLGLS